MKKINILFISSTFWNFEIVKVILQKIYIILGQPEVVSGKLLILVLHGNLYSTSKRSILLDVSLSIPTIRIPYGLVLVKMLVDVT